jgi:BirA family transcriptional regulator, biotin operon repressor / biotin---[acetyl-CoA-carboxylase] ligase
MTREPRLPTGFKLIMHDVVDSTNIVARNLAADDGAAHGTVVVAARQAAGRGRRGNSWVSPPGNLYCSMVLRPECTIASATLLSFVAALAVSDTILSLGGSNLDVWCKWPNDVFIGDGKVAGILLECEGTQGSPNFVILGIGINLSSHPLDTPYPTTSLDAHGCGTIEVLDAVEALLRHFAVWSDRWQEDGFTPIRTAWLARARGMGKPLTVRLGNETLKGTFDDIDQDGALIVGAAGGARRVSAGEVFLGDG